jgi:hypothetical protein
MAPLKTMKREVASFAAISSIRRGAGNDFTTILNARFLPRRVSAAAATAAEPGAVWILRALRAVPQLAHVRIESHRLVTDKLTEVYAPLFPELSRKMLWRRLRIAIEIGFAIDEMLNEEDRIARNDLLRETARLMRWSLTDPLPLPESRPATRKRPSKRRIG